MLLNEVANKTAWMFRRKYAERKRDIELKIQQRYRNERCENEFCEGCNTQQNYILFLHFVDRQYLLVGWIIGWLWCGDGKGPEYDTLARITAHIQ